MAQQLHSWIYIQKSKNVSKDLYQNVHNSTLLNNGTIQIVETQMLINW